MTEHTILIIQVSRTGLGWGPGALYQSVCNCTWTDVSSSNRIERNYKELKATEQVTIALDSRGNYEQ